MKRLIVLLVVVLPLSLAMTGCGPSGGTSSDTKPAAGMSKEKVDQMTKQRMEEMKKVQSAMKGGTAAPAPAEEKK